MHWQQHTATTLAPLTTAIRLGVITDMDGTISPIVEHPHLAQVTPRNLELLKNLQSYVTLVAVISGRGASDIQQRIGLDDIVYIGNHGLERWEDGAVHIAPDVLPFRSALENIQAQIPLQPGMFIEDKGATLSIHYRQTANPSAVVDEYTPRIKALAEEFGLRFFPGRMIFEIRPPLEVHKGTALAYLVDHYDLDTVLFLGDDVTDTDAMRVAHDLHHQQRCYAVTVGVLSADTPPIVREQADVLAQGVGDIERLLAWLLNARMASST